MYAVIQSGGKQYKVSPGDVIRVEKLTGEDGAAVEFPALMVAGEAGVKAGKAAAGAKVTGSIVGAGRNPKIIVFKFKRKKQYKRTKGHRQSFTSVKIDEIHAG